MTRQILLNAFNMNCPGHQASGLWRHPRDRSREYPIVLNRTPYSCRPYGPAVAQRIGPSAYMERDGYIFVKQDVRGRWMRYFGMPTGAPGYAWSIEAGFSFFVK